ncbi:MAG: DUF3649 domain-containing protein [Pseudomonadota bacterium]
MGTTKALTLEYRLGILSRVLAASVGAYVLVNLANYALSFLLPFEQYQGLLFAMQISFLFYTLAIIWAFAARTARRAWFGLLIVAAPLALIAAYYYFSGAP